MAEPSPARDTPDEDTRLHAPAETEGREPSRALLASLPMRGLTVRVGTQTNCAGIARADADLEAGAHPRVEVVDAVPPDPDADVREVAAMCVANIGIGARAAFRESFGAEPPVRLVIRRVLPHLVDANENVNRRAGRAIVGEVLRRLS
ncbi:hypothetical protein [Phytomonospora endophytica]|uniref:Uncharacterized protein n=1 Tax=Phytomonospora endophytica TaxID=714109 RepID=A0A841FV05_9ACTN|nr:hypothetical protein [Phytomonospora endophytica]MBB6036339.1 hypothetical protein [Phytomonospora endophytica]GIG67246.1 hypothetical protein Pen01_35410 [Phytomonospora endophytica]